MNISERYEALLDELHERAISGDAVALQALCCMALLSIGWRFGDPDPGGDDDPGGGCEVLCLADYRKTTRPLRLVLGTA